MKSPLISVIVPVYNAEKYLRRCLDSVLAQTYTNWECICVNDGSSDGSLSILYEYASADARIRVLTQENKGISCTRNRGLENVRGEYLIFIDSDDSIHPQLMEICIYQALRDDSDAVIYSLSHSYRNLNRIARVLRLPDFRPRYKKFDKEKVDYVYTEDIFSYVTERSHVKYEGIDNRFRVKHCRIWHALYRSDTVRNIRFCPGIRYEDCPWWGMALLHIRKATINKLPLYYYYPSETSFIITSDRHEKAEHLEKAIAVAEKIYENAGTPRQRMIWEERFMVPFRNSLKKKRK